MVELGESGKMMKINRKVDKSNSKNRFKSCFFFM